MVTGLRALFLTLSNGHMYEGLWTYVRRVMDICTKGYGHMYEGGLSYMLYMIYLFAMFLTLLSLGTKYEKEMLIGRCPSLFTL